MIQAVSQRIQTGMGAVGHDIDVQYLHGFPSLQSNRQRGPTDALRPRSPHIDIVLGDDSAGRTHGLKSLEHFFANQMSNNDLSERCAYARSIQIPGTNYTARAPGCLP